MPYSPVIAVGAGVFSAVAVLSIAFGSILALPLFYLAPLPLYLAGLGIGVKGTVIATVTALVMMAFIGSATIAIPFAVAYGMPSIMVTQSALKRSPAANGQAIYTSPGSIVSAVTAIGMIALFVVAMMSSADEAGSLSNLVRDTLDQGFSTMASDVAQEDRELLVSVLAPFFPGLVVSGWIVMHVVNLALAQNILSKSNKSLRPSAKLTSLTLPEYASYLLVAAGVAALVLPGEWTYLGRNLFVIASVPFFLLGLAVVHRFAATVSRPTTVLTVFYIILLVLGWSALLVVCIGALEQWAGLRKRMKPVNHQE